MGIMQQSACRFVNPITVYSNLDGGQAPDSMTALT